MAKVSASAASSKKTGGTKRKRLTDEDTDSNQAITAVFKKVKKEEYDDAIRKELSQQISSQSSMAGPSTQSQSAKSQLSPPTSPARTPATTKKIRSPLSGFRDRAIANTEARLRAAYNHSENIENMSGETKPRELITYMVRMSLDHVQRSSYSLNGVIRAVAMEHHAVDAEAVGEAWRRAQRGEAFPRKLLAYEATSSTTRLAPEPWETDSEAIQLLDQDIEAIGLRQLQQILQWSYKLARRVSQEITFDPYFSLLIHVMRHLSYHKFSLPGMMLAMARELRGESMDVVEDAWAKARVADE
ncbi:uncharacterized protein AB675_3936 [Cyphellophora attinorum]|uniref:Uncharacterized protein n=1 Tax=Cyphellophora attinorum TaxID=1664694 RepID=A0A0N0NK19_9EURO|nr:uncharacterized protein AB675_3936 [Phialophora attinorum]KPI37538.1 hypothetical protein AB675_3936 [Phialophora attinorum]